MLVKSGVGLLAGLLLVGVAVPAQEPTRRELLDAFEKQLKQVATTAGPTIACIVVSRSDQYPKPAGDTPGKLGAFNPKEFLKIDPSVERSKLAKQLDLADIDLIPDHGYSGGVVIDPSGLVLTLYHVIEGATKIYVFLPGGGGSYADIWAADARSDLAVLKLIQPPPGLKAIRIAEVNLGGAREEKPTLFPGKLVALLANPYSSTFGIQQPSIAPGSITNIRQRIAPPLPRPGEFQPQVPKQDSYYKFGFLLEHDIRLNAGISGGILTNLEGELVGLTSATAVVYNNREIGPGFAIPADEGFRRIVDVLRNGEEVEYGFLGVILRSGATEIVLDKLTAQGPAAISGLRPGDIIVKINGHNTENYEDLLLHIGQALAGGKVKITAIQRDGREHDFEVTLAKFRHDRPFIASAQPVPVFGLRVDHGSILSQQLTGNARIEASGVPPGVSVRELSPNSAAETQFKTLGLTPNAWLITQVNGNPVSNPQEFYKHAKGQEKVKLTVIDPTELNPRPREITLP